MLIPPWVKWALLLLFVGGYTVGVFWLGGEHARKVAANDQLKAVFDIVKDSQQRQQKLQEALDKLPKAEKTINEIVHKNPSPCERPKPLDDGLREAIDKANRARKMPSDS